MPKLVLNIQKTSILKVYLGGLYLTIYRGFTGMPQNSHPWNKKIEILNTDFNNIREKSSGVWSYNERNYKKFMTI